MKFYQTYTASSLSLDCPPFQASVPGNVQLDYITAHPEFVSDINYGTEHKKMVALEPYTWFYKTNLEFTRNPCEKIWFVTEGIDYIWTLLLNGREFFTHEGMFSRIEICLDDECEKLFGRELTPGDVLEVKIHPHPMLEGMPMGRGQAAQCCKPPVAYEWDWHPRVIPSGIWDDTYIESRNSTYIGLCEARYTLAPDYSSAELCITVECDTSAKQDADVVVTAPDGTIVASGKAFGGEFKAKIENPKLWWCRGYGEPNLYKYTVSLGENTKSGSIGFRRVQLTLNKGRTKFRLNFPQTRNYPPAQITLNGVDVFAKGSNYVNQEIFTGTMTREKYEENIKLAIDANMNIFRCWGGSGCQKDDFYSLCDEYGMMIWFEFPLACNYYNDTTEYLYILKQEATAIIKKLRSHPCISIWCGGNELCWSGMTEQNLSLRLLNSLTLQYAPEIPYNITSPIYGMRHGGYTFIDLRTGEDQFTIFGNSEATAYTEFGIPGTPPADYLRTFIPEDELFPPKPGGAWQSHHGFWAWSGENQWLCLPILERFGDISTFEAMVETSERLQGVGYKAIFEEARRQKPMCAMAVNWCWCEPWKCAANNSLVAYPNVKKAGYFTVKDSLRDVVPSAKFAKFAWNRGEKFEFELWLLNDGLNAPEGDIIASVEIDGVNYYIGTSHVAAQTNNNAEGGTVSMVIPESATPKTVMKVTLEFRCACGTTIVNEYNMFIEK